ncbi:MAG: B12-binding domain-containing radical SAM protein [Oscillospiraceae bacterium]|jgi:radical SAM superfamily enzyme YgiQ (UPF0313 family)|nr:B12-binding domain-containing radical SAM protein [Oscillospiraceae bacterium]
MKIAVIKPSLFGERSRDALNPLLFAILKPLTPANVELLFYDENIEELPESLSCNAAAVTIDTFTARRGYILAQRLRAKGIKVIMGGCHATFCPEEVLRYADAVAIGEAEDTWGQIVADLCAGQLKPVYKSQNNADMSQIEYDYSVFKGKRYNPLGFVQFSRGCKFRCDFCSIHAFYGDSIRTRPAELVADSIRNTPQKLLFFSDDNLFASKEQTDALLKAVKPLKKRWVCQISMDAAQDKELLLRMAQSGCIMVIVGFESLNRENLKLMGKSANLKSDYRSAINNIHSAGIMIYATFVIGYDADTKETAAQLVKFAAEHSFAVANFNPLIPTPGTRLYERLKSENRLLFDTWWNDPEYKYGDTAFVPKGMKPEELAEACKAARFEFYSPRCIFKRLRGANSRGLFRLFIYLLVNFVSRSEIHHKQGRRLGE